MLSRIDWREIPIPRKPTQHDTQTYHDITFQENELSHEPLLPIATSGVLCRSYYARSDGLNTPYCRRFASAAENPMARSTVVDKLVAVNECLRPYNVELLVVDAHRSHACQSELWEHFLTEAQKRLGRVSNEEITAFAEQYCSNPIGFNLGDARTWPTHITGAAIDVVLRERGFGEMIYMGGVFDDPSEVSHTRYYENEPQEITRAEVQSSVEAKRNRRLLFWAMAANGFANYPYEWWHFDWGNQMWVLNRLACLPGTELGSSAWYGPVV